MFEDAFFNRKKANPSKLLAYGFQEKQSVYVYTVPILDAQFLYTVQVDGLGRVNSRMVEQDTGEEYVLYRTKGAAGSFIGAVKAQCEGILTKISEECFDPDVFKSKQSHELIAYVRSQYGGELEFLWEKFPDNAVWRRSDTKKWYGAILTVSKRKLGLSSDETVEIIDLRYPCVQMPALLDNRRYFPGWHMNKKSWYTVILDGSVPTGELCERIDTSYFLATK